MRLVPAFLLFILIFTGLAKAGEVVTINPTDENGINEALNKGGTVYLTAGVYGIKGPIYIGSDTVLTGDKDAIIKVSSSSSQWFVEGTGLINHKDYPLKNVEICGFQIDGNLDELPRSYADYGNGDHNAERAVYLRGNKKAFMENISVHDLEIYDTYSDGIQIAYCNNAQVYNNFISNCQHSGIFLISVVGANVFKNDVAGITSDCLRLDNCVNNKIFENTLYSYTGDNLQGQGTNGENGLQIADEGFSHGGGSAKPTHTTDIEVYGNTFANTGWHGIWLDSTGKGYDNVYIHSNTFLNGEEFTNSGSKVEGISVEGIDFEHPPSKEMSRQVFTSIFDILRMDYTYRYPSIESDLEASGRVTFYNYSYEPYSLVGVEGEDLKVIKYEYAGKSTRYFAENDLWVGDLQHVGNDLYIPGKFDNTSLKVTVYSDSGFQKVEDIEVRNFKLVSASINPDLFVFLAVLLILGISISRNLRRIF